jgi:hypothetical protein
VTSLGAVGLTTLGESLDADLQCWLADPLGGRVTVADAWGQLELSVTRARPPAPHLLPIPG